MCAATHYHDEMGKKGLVMFMYIVDFFFLENFLKLIFFIFKKQGRYIEVLLWELQVYKNCIVYCLWWIFYIHTFGLLTYFMALLILFHITFTLLNKQKWMYLVINLRGEETFSSTTPPLTMYSLIHLDPWWCIRQYMLTPDNVLCIEFLTCEKSNTQFFFHKTVVKMFPHNRKPNNQDIILIYGMFYWSQYCKDYDNFSKVKCCYFLVTFLRKRPKIHKNGYTKMAMT